MQWRKFWCCQSDKVSQWDGFITITEIRTRCSHNYKDDLMEDVLALSCNGLRCLILNLLKEDFWLGFPLKWGFSLTACLHLVYFFICFLALALMTRKDKSKELIIIKTSQANVINKVNHLTTTSMDFPTWY